MAVLSRGLPLPHSRFTFPPFLLLLSTSSSSFPLQVTPLVHLLPVLQALSHFLVNFRMVGEEGARQGMQREEEEGQARPEERK